MQQHFCMKSIGYRVTYIYIFNCAVNYKWYYFWNLMMKVIKFVFARFEFLFLYFLLLLAKINPVDWCSRRQCIYNNRILFLISSNFCYYCCCYREKFIAVSLQIQYTQSNKCHRWKKIQQNKLYLIYLWIRRCLYYC